MREQKDRRIASQQIIQPVCKHACWLLCWLICQQIVSPGESVEHSDQGDHVTRTIGVCTQKGGVGKTTTVANLAAAWGAGGRRVLAIDSTRSSPSLGGSASTQPRGEPSSTFWKA